jgi:hypothetical protein
MVKRAHPSYSNISPTITLTPTTVTEMTKEIFESRNLRVYLRQVRMLSHSGGSNVNPKIVTHIYI